MVHEIVASIGSHMMQRLAGVTSAAAALRTYIEGNVQFIWANREQMKALLEIFLNGAFDPKVMATLVQRAVDGLPFLLPAKPDLDVQAYGAEVATVFELATRRTA